MKTITLPTFMKLFMMTSILVFSSCKKDEVDPAPFVTQPITPAVPSNSFYAKVDGVEFVETLFSAFSFSAANAILITASQNGGVTSIGLNVADDIAVGTYTFSFSGQPSATYNVSSDVNDSYVTDNQGTLVITTHDLSAKFIEGTFNYLATPNIGSTSTSNFDITEGAFAVSY